MAPPGPHPPTKWTCPCVLSEGQMRPTRGMQNTFDQHILTSVSSHQHIHPSVYSHKHTLTSAYSNKIYLLFCFPTNTYLPLCPLPTIVPCAVFSHLPLSMSILTNDRFLYLYRACTKCIILIECLPITGSICSPQRCFLTDRTKII